MNDLSNPPVPIDMHLREIDEPVFDPERAAWMAAVFCGSPDEDDLVAPWPGYPFSPQPVDFNMIVAGNRRFNLEFGRR